MRLATTGTETENLFETLANKVPVGLHIIQDGKFVYVNPGFQSITGYRENELLGKHSLELVVPEDREMVRENAIKMLKGELTLPYQFRVVHKDGSIKWVMESVVSTQYRGRRATLGYFADVTEHKQTEEALQTEKNKLQSLLDAMEDHLTIRDKDYNLIYQCEASKKMFGDGLGEKCYRVYHGREEVCEGCPVEKAFKDGKSHRAERKTVTPSGELIFWENTANPIRNARREIVACLEIARDITERKKQEQAMAEELTRRRILVDQSLDGIVVLDEDARVVEANRRFAEMLGYTPEEVRKLHTWDWDKQFPPERLLEMGRSIDEKGLHLETKHTRKDGSVIDVDISISAAMFRGEKLIFCVCRDITERKKMEEALRESREQLKNMFESVTDSISVIDLNGVVTETNQATVKMHGFSCKDEVIGKSAVELIGARDRQRVTEYIKKVLKLGLKERLECSMLRADGTEYPGELSTSALKDGSGRLVGHIAISRNITDRKRMETALNLAAEEWRRTFDSITDAVSIHDRDFRIQRANKAFADLFHTEISQVVGKRCYELHKRSEPRSSCPHQQTLSTKKPATTEFYESNLGKFLLESTSPIFDDQGEVVATVHITRDITAQKQQTERLMIADRLASLGELAAGCAHELNNPLTGIIGFAQLLREKDIPDDIHEDVEFIYNEAQRAASITKHLLTFARKHAPVKQLCQINNIIEDMLKLRAHELKVNSIEVKKQLAPDLPEIIVDYFQMQQVFLNIIINAEYFMIEAHKRGTLTITTKKQNGKVMISFADDGPGIPEENLGRIFDPFFTTKPTGRGTGLGLSICHGIVTEHGGQIYAESQPHKGATIFIELPINGRDHIGDAMKQATVNEKSILTGRGEQ